MASSDSFALLLNQVASDLRDWTLNINGILVIIGAWYTLRFTVRLGICTFNCIRHSYLFQPKTNFVKNYGSWAIVTGSTSGIGNAFANALAAKGLNVVLIARNEVALEENSKYIERHYGVHTFAIQQDFNYTSVKSMKVIQELIDTLEVGVLVNNVGMHYEYPIEFHHLDEQRMHSMLQVNMSAAVVMTRAVLPGMIKRRQGLVVNISSAAGSFPFPLISLYSATKAFVNHFSSALHEEMKPYNVHVQSLMPYYVNTKMVAFSPSLRSNKLFVPSPDTYVKHAMRTLGHYKVNTGYFPHTFQAWMQSLAPRCLVNYFSLGLNRRLNSEGVKFQKKK